MAIRLGIDRTVVQERHQPHRVAGLGYTVQQGGVNQYRHSHEGLSGLSLVFL